MSDPGVDPGSPQPRSAEEPLPLLALERCLDPVRRVVLYALRAGVDAVPYFGSTVRPLVDEALLVDMPHAIRDGVAKMCAALDDFDERSSEARAAALRDLHQQVARIDAVLGLPLHRRRAFIRTVGPGVLGADPEPSVEGSEVPGEPADEARPPVRRAWARGTGGRDPAPEPRAPSPDAPSSWFLHHAEPLADAGAAWGVAGLRTTADVLLARPRECPVIHPIRGAGREAPPGRVALAGRVGARVTLCRPDGGASTEITLIGAGPVQLRIAPAARAAVLDRLAHGSRAVVVGDHVPDDAGGHLDDVEVATPDGDRGVPLPRFGVDGLPDRDLRAARFDILRGGGPILDPVPARYRPKGPTLDEAVRGGAGDDACRRRLAWFDAFLLHLGMRLGTRSEAKERGVVHPTLHAVGSRLERALELNFDLSAAIAFEDIKRDLRSPRPMRRLLGGGPGAKRGAIGLLVAATVAESRTQVLVVADDPARLVTHFTFCEPVLREVGLVARLARQAPGRAQRDALRRGEIHVLFAPVDSLDHPIEFRRLGLVVAHESGSEGRAASALAALRGTRPDLLVIPAVAPSCDALLGPFADCQVSWVGPLRPEAVESVVVGGADRTSAYDRAAEVVAGGRQALVLFPLVGGADALDPRQAARVVAALQAEVFPGRRVDLLHGEAPRDEQFRIYDDFRRHRFDVLVATVGVEDGPDVPGLGAVVVEQADRVDPVRLRRARAMVAGRPRGVCLYVLGELPDPGGAERVALVATRSGVELTETFAGTRTSVCGGPWLDVPGDMDVLLAARSSATALLSRDPGMRRTEHGELLNAVRWRWPLLSPEPCPAGEPVEVTPRVRKRRRRRRR